MPNPMPKGRLVGFCGEENWWTSMTWDKCLQVLDGIRDALLTRCRVCQKYVCEICLSSLPNEICADCETLRDTDPSD